MVFEARVCQDCGITINHLYHNATRCKPCAKDRKRHTNKINAKKTKCKGYGISAEEYDAMYELQGGCCAICGRHQSKMRRSLHIDHNHATGHVRGLLCGNCNPGLWLI
ncbi:MAG: endonuclease VII domain-containing protein [Candidatus Thorarchaeota archaeon]